MGGSWGWGAVGDGGQLGMLLSHCVLLASSANLLDSLILIALACLKQLTCSIAIFHTPRSSIM